jgi:hypothetical protein
LSAPSPERLAEECATWTRYLIDEEPSESVVAGYQRAHATGVVESPGGASAFDRALVGFARRGPRWARLADVHARVFAARGLLRRKLVIALALLETDRRAHARIDLVACRTRGGLVLATCTALAGFAIASTAGLFLFVPLRIACAAVPRAAKAGARAR